MPFGCLRRDQQHIGVSALRHGPERRDPFGNGPGRADQRLVHIQVAFVFGKIALVCA
jgi:hypothetical protein